MAGIRHDPFAERDDQSGLLCQRDENARRDRPHLGVVPAHQGFDARDFAGLQIDLGLEMRREIIAFDRLSKIGFQLEPLACLVDQAVIKDAPCVLPAALGKEKRAIGLREQLLGIVGMLWEAGRANAGGDRQQLLLDEKRLGDARQQSLAVAGNIVATGMAMHDHSEACAVEPREKIAVPLRFFAQALGNFHEDLIA